jgi:hypothetical protein
MACSRDTYHPADSTAAACPHCGAILTGAPAATFPQLVTALLTWCCPRCNGYWSEMRTERPVIRLWDPHPGSTSAPEVQRGR